MKKIIINADDFGLTTGCNIGIIKAIKEGIVTSTTIMMNMPKATQGIELAKGNNLESLGVHLNLTQGKPLLSREVVPSLVDGSGNFKKINDILLDFVAIQVKNELREQIESFLRTGLKLSHLDSHHSIHMQDGYGNIFIKLANEYGVPLRKINYGKKRFMKMIVNKLAGKNKYLTTDRFYGKFYGKNVSMDTLKKIIMKASNGGTTEIMTHPGYSDDELVALSSYNKQRVMELEILTSDEMIKWINKQNIELTSYNEIIDDCQSRGNFNCQNMIKQ